jgi:putative endonuclease
MGHIQGATRLKAPWHVPAMVALHLQRGAAAEILACAYLQSQGLNVVARNLRCKVGEIDIVCLDHEVLVIVEVRQRGRADFGGGLASVTRKKQRKLIRATQFHWQRRPDWRARVLRFDVIALEDRPDGAQQLTWIQDAFRAD